jgi:hypothetical protein
MAPAKSQPKNGSGPAGVIHHHLGWLQTMASLSAGFETRLICGVSACDGGPLRARPRRDHEIMADLRCR